MLKGFSRTKSGKRTSKRYAPNSPEKQPFKQHTKMWNSKIDVPLYIRQKLELEIQNMSAPHDHKHIVGPIILLKNLMLRKLLQMH
jgi:hypothetical protein